MSRIGDILRASTSFLGLATGLGGEQKTAMDDGLKVTKKAGKRGRAFRRIIGYKRVGPLHKQVGEKWLSGECWPVMQTSFRHQFLHATKGWRDYCGGPSMRLPMPNKQQRPNLPRSPFQGWRAHKPEGALGGWRVIKEATA